LQEFQKTEKKNCNAETGPDLIDDESMQVTLGDDYGGRILG
jgi:hypothetical protein